MSILSQYFNITIDCGISALGHVEEILDGLNTTENFIFHMIATVQLLGSKQFDTQMTVNTETQNTDMSLALEF